MAIERDIRYNIQAVDNTEQAFKEVERNNQETTDKIKKSQDEIAKNANKVAAAFKDVGKQELKSLKSGVKDVGNAFINLPKAIMKAFTSAITGAIKTLAVIGTLRAAIKGLDWIMNKTGDSTSIFGKGLNKIAQGLQFVVKSAAPVRQMMAKIGNTIGKQSKLWSDLTKAFDLYRMGLQGVHPGAEMFQQATGTINSMSKAMRGLGLIANNLGGTIRNTIIKPMVSVKTAADKASTGMDKISKVGDSVLNVVKSIGRALPLAGKAFLFLKDHIVGVTVAVIAAVAAIKALQAAWKMANEIATMGDAIDKASRRVAFAADAYQAWDHILQHAGTSMSELEMSIASLSKKMLDARQGTGEAKKAFEALGIQLVNADGTMRKSEDAFTEIMANLADMEDVTLRNALAMQIFGMRGRAIIPVLDENSKALKKNYDEAKKNLTITEHAVAASARFKDAQLDLKTAFDVAKANLMANVIDRLADSIEIIVNSNAGKVIGAIIGKILNELSKLIAAINFLIAAFDLGFSTILYGWQKVYNAIVVGLYELLDAANNIKFLEKLVPDSAVQYFAKQVIKMEEALEDTSTKMQRQAAMVAKSFKSIFVPQKTKPLAVTGAGLTPDLDKDEDNTKKLLDNRKRLYEQFHQWLKRAELEAITNPTLKALKQIEQEYQARSMTIFKAVGKGITFAEAERMWSELAAITEAAKRRLAETVIAGMPMLRRVGETRPEVEARGKKIAARKEHDEQLAILNKFREEDLISQQQYHDQKLALDMAYAEKRGMIEKELQEQLMAAQEQTQTSTLERIEGGIQLAGEAFGHISDTYNMYQDMQMAKMNERYNRERRAIESTPMWAHQRNAKLAKLDEKREQEEKRMNKNKQKMAFVQSIIQGALAVTNALSSSPPPINFIMAGLVGAAAAAQSAMIASQAFAKGGIVSGVGGTDSQIVRATPGEMVLTPEQQANLFAIAQGRGGGSVGNIDMSINIEGNVNEDILDEVSNIQQANLIKLREQLEELNYQNELSFLKAV